MEKLQHRIYRNWISLKTLMCFFSETLTYWPFAIWIRFWFTKHGAPYYEDDYPHIFVRTKNWLEKIVDGHMLFTCISKHQYEPAGFEIHRRYVVVDVGAHIGSFALLAATHGNRVVACEPSPDNFAMFLKNIRHNKIQNITALPICITGANGEREFFLDKQNKARNGIYGKVNGNSIKVRSLTLDELLKTENITHVDFLKVDCEGAEYEIFENTTENTFSKISRIAMEYHIPPYFGLDKNKHNISNIIKKFHSNGFSVRIEPENKLRGLIFASRISQQKKENA